MIKKPFLLTQGEIMPNRGIYENSFKSTIWYSKKLKDVKKIREEYIKLAGFTDEDIERIDNEITSTKKKNENIEVEKEKEDPVIIKKIEVELPVESKKEEIDNSEKKIEFLEQETEEEQILNSVITRLNEI